jgi:hypothetical protein
VLGPIHLHVRVYIRHDNLHVALGSFLRSSIPNAHCLDSVTDWVVVRRLMKLERGACEGIGYGIDHGLHDKLMQPSKGNLCPRRDRRRVRISLVAKGDS